MGSITSLYSEADEILDTSEDNNGKKKFLQ